ncbi:MAG: TetR/AcrR family transcriptional regulator [Lachnospiraceae bacterium]
MQNNQKRDLILDAMQELMNTSTTQSISVSEIAKVAGIGKGSIYYYFKSKEEIIEAVIERSYSSAIEKAKSLVDTKELTALEKLEIVFHACRDSSLELLRQEASSFLERQQSALLHQQYIRIMIRNLCPILADIIRQGNSEKTMYCKSPEEAAEIVLIVLLIKMDSQLNNQSLEQRKKTLDVFSYMVETSFGIDKGKLDYLWTTRNKD